MSHVKKIQHSQSEEQTTADGYRSVSRYSPQHLHGRFNCEENPEITTPRLLKGKRCTALHCDMSKLHANSPDYEDCDYPKISQKSGRREFISFVQRSNRTESTVNMGLGEDGNVSVENGAHGILGRDGGIPCDSNVREEAFNKEVIEMEASWGPNPVEAEQKARLAIARLLTECRRPELYESREDSVKELKNVIGSALCFCWWTRMTDGARRAVCWCCLFLCFVATLLAGAGLAKLAGV